jgi:LuxR family transcriptional regulator, maltose regulon positive regulatory protein
VQVETHSAAVDAGLRALSDTRWLEARDIFRQALREGEVPEALEGLSWAAWWLDDAPLVFDARERAYRAYRQARRTTDAARMAIWLAIDHLDFNGSLAVGNGWLRRAGRLLEGTETAPEHGWLAFQEGYVAQVGGDFSLAQKRAREAAELGRRFDVADLEMLGLALEGSALVASARIAEGMRTLDEATATALEGDASVPMSCAWAFCFLVSACLEVRDYRRAFEWCDRIAEFAERHGSRYMLGFCRSHYGAIHLSRGRWADAEAEILAAVQAYEQSRPAMTGDALAWLAELRRRQGRLEECARILERAGDTMAVLICRARLALDQGDDQRAVDLAERGLRQVREGAPHAAPALELLVRARAARGELSEAGSRAVELKAAAERAGTVPMRASTLLADGLVAAAQGDADAARRAMEDAVGAYAESGAAFEELTTRLDLAMILAGVGRTESARAEAGTALHGLEVLGAEHEASRARRVLADLEPHSAARPPNAAALTPREREVLGFVARGWTNRQIAAHLVVSEHTVHRHVTNLLRKLDVPTRSAAAALAAHSGLVPTEAP